jgi:hypothetical protein
MHGVERDDAARHVKLFQQFLHRWYLVGLFIDLDMRQHQRRIDGKDAERCAGSCASTGCNLLLGR